MAVSPPFSISETLPADSDLISIFPSQEHPYRDTVESWLTFLSDPTTGLLKSTAFSFPFVVSNTGVGTFMQFVSTDAGAAEAPDIDLYRNSASPAVADVLGGIIFSGQDSGGAKQTYALINSQIASTTAGAENGTLYLQVVSAGTVTPRVTLTTAGVTLAGVVTYSGVITGLTGTGALASGSIAAGFGTINIGANTLTAGAATLASMASSGAVSGTTGTFSGAVSGTTGSFSSTVTGVAGTFSGALTGANVLSSTNIFAPSSANTMELRPSGAASTTGRMTIATNGNVTAAGDITASSDRRLKKSISPLNHLWANDMVREVQPVTFLRKKSDTRSIGFVAQDVQPYAPELVQTDDHGMLSLAYPNMVAILWAVVQDLQKKIEELSQ